MKIVDASVALKWFIDEEGSDRALEILTQIQNTPHLFAVPDFFFIEMMSVLSRLVKNSDALKQYLRDLEDLGCSRIGVGHQLLQRAAEIAVKTKLSGYDAFYAATAESLKGKWITADKKAHEKVFTLKLTELL